MQQTLLSEMPPYAMALPWGGRDKPRCQLGYPMQAYIALIHKDAGSDYGVSFPDFPGCITAGRSLDEARQFAEEALAFHIDGMIEDGDAVPRPSSLETIMADQVNRGGVAVLVDAPMLADH